MVLDIAVRFLATHTIAVQGVARRPAHVVVAGRVDIAVVIGLTFAQLTLDEWVAHVVLGAGAHRSRIARPVSAGAALGIETTWVRVAVVIRAEWSAAHEGVTSVASGTGTDGLVVGGLAVRSITARVDAGVDAAVVLASLV